MSSLKTTSSLKNSRLDKYITFIKYTFQHKHSVIVCSQHGKIYKNEKTFLKNHAIKGYCKSVKVIVDVEYIEKRIAQCTTKIISFRCIGEDGHEYLLPNSCYNRLCSKCITTRHSRYIKKISKVIKTFKRPKLITFTIKGHYPFTFKKTADYYFSQMLRFIRKNKAVDGYIKVLEANPRENLQFYFHYHVIMDCDFLPRELIKEQWEKITKGSYIVDIRPVRMKTKDLAHYLAKYLSKSFHKSTATRQSELQTFIDYCYMAKFYTFSYNRALLDNTAQLNQNLCPFDQQLIRFHTQDPIPKEYWEWSDYGRTEIDKDWNFRLMKTVLSLDKDTSAVLDTWAKRYIYIKVYLKHDFKDMLFMKFYKPSKPLNTLLRI